MLKGRLCEPDACTESAMYGFDFEMIAKNSVQRRKI